jgi:subtilisin family serine protease
VAAVNLDLLDRRSGTSVDVASSHDLPRQDRSGPARTGPPVLAAVGRRPVVLHPELGPAPSNSDGVVALSPGIDPVRPLAEPQIEKLDRVLRGLVTGDPTAPVRVIIQTTPGVQTATATWLTGEGRQVHRVHPGIGGVTATLSASDVAALSSEPTVRRISIDAVIRPSSDTRRPARGLRQGGGATPVDARWVGATVGVAVVDSGIEPSSDIPARRITGFYDFTQGGASTRPFDDHGHGTHVAGLIGGNGAGARGRFRGLAPAAHLVGYKVLDAEGNGYTSDVIAAVRSAVLHRATLGIDVINLSLGHVIHEPAATDARTTW